MSRNQATISFRLHEEIIATGGFIKDQNWGTRFNVGQTKSVMTGAKANELSSAAKAKLLKFYSTLRSSLASVLEARMKQMADGLQMKLAELADKEAKVIESILTKLKKSMKTELNFQRTFSPSCSMMQCDLLRFGKTMHAWLWPIRQTTKSPF